MICENPATVHGLLILTLIVLQVMLFYNNIMVRKKGNKMSVRNAKLTLEIER